ncbi:MAG: hypothetical protein WB987_05305 [Candidatus Acidiferrales bacterium]
MKSASLILAIVGSLVLYGHPPPARAQNVAAPEVIKIDAHAQSHPFPHSWEHMFGSGRAILSLRESYRTDLREVKAATDFQYVRFHAIFHDEVGVYDEDAAGNPIYSFSYVDQIYDGLLQNHVRPFVELSFMPRKLAASDSPHAFWYKPNVAPPKNYDRWAALITAFVKHLVDRYGIDEVSQWYFEVWNEPNLDFWTGDPKEATYYDLYDKTARAIKNVSVRLRVGGPATAQAAWVDRFIRHCADKNVPVDFVSTHVYGDDKPHDVFGTDENIPRTKMVCLAARKVFDEVKSSPLPALPIIWSEYNATFTNNTTLTDSSFMAPWLADTIRQCDGLADSFSYWTFSDVFEEQGVVKKPFYGGFGLMAEGDVPKPVFNAFALLHLLGNRRLDLTSDSALATERPDGSLAIAVWNLFLPEDAGHDKTVTLDFAGLGGRRRVLIHQLDSDHGSPLPAYRTMGQPATPTLEQFHAMQRAAQLPAERQEHLTNGSITLTLPPQSLLLIEVR